MKPGDLFSRVQSGQTTLVMAFTAQQIERIRQEVVEVMRLPILLTLDEADMMFSSVPITNDDPDQARVSVVHLLPPNDDCIAVVTGSQAPSLCAILVRLLQSIIAVATEPLAPESNPCKATALSGTTARLLTSQAHLALAQLKILKAQLR